MPCNRRDEKHARVVARACRNPSRTFGVGRISQSRLQTTYNNTGFRHTHSLIIPAKQPNSDV
eukprot:614275-Pyramimonas_sp.AAC.1